MFIVFFLNNLQRPASNFLKAIGKTYIVESIVIYIEIYLFNLAIVLWNCVCHFKHHFFARVQLQGGFVGTAKLSGIGPN